MNLEPGLVIVIGAALFFYLRLIMIQQQRVKNLAKPVEPKGKKKGKTPEPAFRQRYSILSRRRSDQIIAGIGLLAIVAGALLSSRAFPIPAAQPYWWIPTAAGIIAFSWAFKLS